MRRNICLTANQGLTIGSPRTRIDCSATVTSAPLLSASSTLDQMVCSNAARAVASRPSFRIRITDGPRSQPWIAAGPDRAEGVSYRLERLHALVQIPRGKFERLTNILRFKFWILAPEIIPVRIDRERLDDTPHGKAHTP